MGTNDVVACREFCDGCFANKNGFCRILIDNNFGERKCPFYKTKWQISQEEKKAAEKFLGEEGN